MERISNSYLDFLTDNFSIWQHSKGRQIDSDKGYSLDDGARALIYTLSFEARPSARVYYEFLRKSIDDDFVNFYDKDRQPLASKQSEDAIGQTYWALVLWKKENETIKLPFEKIEETIRKFKSSRGLAYSLVGASLKQSDLSHNLCLALIKLFDANSTGEWPWVEQELTYANAIIPLSFLEYYAFCGKTQALKIGLRMLDFLNKEMKVGDIPIAIGNHGWYAKGSTKALYDQQPIDIGYQVLTNVRAFEITRDQKYLDEAFLFFSWFWGNNLNNKSLIDVTAQRCLDGLQTRSISKNSGAESIICFLWAQETLWPHLMHRIRTTVPASQSKILKNFFGDISKSHAFLKR